jgi:hypothetical protein
MKPIRCVQRSKNIEGKELDRVADEAAKRADKNKSLRLRGTTFLQNSRRFRRG